MLTWLAGFTFAAGVQFKVTSPELGESVKTLAPLHKKPGKPRAGDWLEHHKERGQTFEQYLKSGPVMPWGKRNTLYIQPVGEFSETQRQVLD